MQPLVAITRAAQHVTASQLHDRVGAARWPAELAELAAAFDAMLDRLEDSFTRLSQFSAALPNYTPRWGFENADPGSAGTPKRFFRARQVYPAP